mmetsp:Transcript_19698/g.35644  ORF Transcript_19698/g.35644 Transcript_19698/m.35644 type:complete len:142 (+) Transcript_19698:1105-1530(+)
MNPTLYVPKPMAGWGVPSCRGIVGQERSACFCSGVGIIELLLLLDDDIIRCCLEEEVEMDDGMDDNAERGFTKAMLLAARLAVAMGTSSSLGRWVVVVAVVVVAAVAKRRDRAPSGIFMGYYDVVSGWILVLVPPAAVNFC